MCLKPHFNIKKIFLTKYCILYMWLVIEKLKYCLLWHLSLLFFICLFWNYIEFCWIIYCTNLIFICKCLILLWSFIFQTFMFYNVVAFPSASLFYWELFLLIYFGVFKICFSIFWFLLCFVNDIFYKLYKSLYNFYENWC